MAAAEFSFLQNHPGLRVVCPLAVGVAVGDGCLQWLTVNVAWGDFLWIYSSGLLALLGVLLGVLWFRHGRRGAFPPRTGFGAVVLVALFVTGALVDALAWRRGEVTWAEESLYYKGVVSDTPREGPRSRTCRVTLTGVMGEDGRMRALCRDVQLTVPADSVLTARPDSVQPGRGIAFRARVGRPRTGGNPDEFDYADYLWRHGVSGTAFAPAGQWCTYVPTAEEQTELGWVARLRIGALALRTWLLHRYAALGLEGECAALVSALTLGDRSGLTEETERLYTDAGASHLLALSGMNLAVFMVVFQLLILRRCRFSRWRWAGGAVVVGFIWTYTLMTGMPSSLVRAALMGTLCVGSYLLRQEHTPLNALGVGAALMLWVDPFYLWDVGFCLSCLSLFFILMLYPPLEGLFPKLRQPWRAVWSTLAVSVAAQLGTMPLVAYLFHQCAPYAALWSVVLVPATSITVYVLLALLVLHGLGLTLLVGWGAVALGWWVEAQLAVLAFSVTLPGAVWRGIYLSAPTMALLYAALLCAVPFYPLRKRWRVAAVLTCLVAAFGTECVCRRMERVQPQVVFYHNRRAPGMLLAYAPSQAYLLTTRPDSFAVLAPYIVKDHWKRRLELSPRVLPVTYRDSVVACTDGLLCAPGVTVLQVGDDRWLHRKADEVWDVDYLHVCRGFRGKLSRLGELFRPRMVVLDASLTDFYLQRYREECDTLGWEAYVMRDEGALKKALP